MTGYKGQRHEKSEQTPKQNEIAMYIANVPGTRAWMLLVSPSSPKGGFYKTYRVSDSDFTAAVEKADRLVARYQGKLPRNVTLPKTLVPRARKLAPISEKPVFPLL